MAMHVEYHMHLGFDGSLMYAHSDLADSLAASPVLQRLVARERLGLVHWQHTTQYVRRGTYDQAMIHNHALLALWARNAWAFITGACQHSRLEKTKTSMIENQSVQQSSTHHNSDLDELFSTPQPTTVHALLGPGGCLANMEAISIPLYDTLCAQCMQTPRLPGTPSAESALWLNASGLDALQHYTLQHREPLQVKMLVQADLVHQFFVHDSLLWEATPKAREGRVQGRDCAFVVHMRNLVDVRVNEVGEYQNTTKWMWMTVP